MAVSAEMPRRSRRIWLIRGAGTRNAFASALAKALRVPAPRINQILRERRGISADTAMRLARYFHGEAQAWMNLQARYDLRRAEISKGRRIRSEVKPSRS